MKNIEAVSLVRFAIAGGVLCVLSAIGAIGVLVMRRREKKRDEERCTFYNDLRPPAKNPIVVPVDDELYRYTRNLHV
ncbi:MAG: hypothetical protein HGA67_01790 [Candidatus Yonathbacteria bacterium]|nr:hypothetical protein [Candidatus Yonathbacteria bacterium]